MSEILIKHYRASFWRQLHRFLSGVEAVYDTFGLVANVENAVVEKLLV